LKINVPEDLMQSDIKNHAFGTTNLRKHFPKDELTLGKNKLIGIKSLQNEVEVVSCGMSA